MTGVARDRPLCRARSSASSFRCSSQSRRYDAGVPAGVAANPNITTAGVFAAYGPSYTLRTYVKINIAGHTLSSPFAIQVNAGAEVPEPASGALLGMGLLGLAGATGAWAQTRRRRNRH